MMIWLLLASIGIGMLIGAVGIGGLLMVPVLGLLAGLTVHEAMATALATFIATGIVGTYLFQKKGSIEWGLTVPVCLGALPFGFAGAYVNSITNAPVLTFLVAAIILFAGVYTLAQWRGLQRPAFEGRPRAQLILLLGIGAFSGFGAGLTGVGGPALSVPTMVMFGFPILPTIGVSQVIQILAAGSGTVGNLAYGTINFGLLLPITLFEVIGVIAGVYIVHAINVELVRRSVAVLCVVVGGLMMGRAAGVF
ncbi:MAG: sulfite exporter TauE/SafE family protein [Thioalkalivibrio sp.]